MTVPGPAAGGRPSSPGEGGQASVEVALVLPLLVGLLVLLAQAGLVVKDYVLVAHAAREAARAAVVDPRPASAEQAARDASGLVRDRLEVRLRRDGRELVSAIVSYRHALNVPFTHRKIAEIPMSVQVTGHVED
ncbi:MAG TPA: TadE/TadG family type IV pilus assembly protein [Acidimicrobiales bacterium]|nr:TadE/TadG family type IV pilus assembly protein [Acidimicrobiales bacterium]